MIRQQICVVLLGLAMAAPAVAADPPARPRPAASPIGSGTNGGAEAVGKMLAPRPVDPDVPLSNPQLSDRTSSDKPQTQPRIYGREETGGGVLGLRFPIPVTPAQ